MSTTNVEQRLKSAGLSPREEWVVRKQLGLSVSAELTEQFGTQFDRKSPSTRQVFAKAMRKVNVRSQGWTHFLRPAHQADFAISRDRPFTFLIEKIEKSPIKNEKKNQ